MAGEVHIELVYDGANEKWWVRKRAANGELVWTTEQYESKEHAEQVAEQEVMFVGLEGYEVIDVNEEG